VPSNNASLWNPDQASARAGADPQAIEVSRGGQRRVLVVDDDEDVTSVLAAILETHGYEVTRLNRAVEALTAAIAADFDAIVCDMIMPGMPGDMFYVAVSKVKPQLAKRFIFITGHGGNPTVAAFLDSVQQPVVYKPFGMDDLLDSVVKMIETQGGDSLAHTGLSA
jgi:DNA-binding NtrC family response regulator